MKKKIKHKIVDDIECKWCCHCKQWQELSYFYKSKSNWDGLEGECKICCAERQKQYRKDNIEKIAKQRKQYQKDNTEKLAKQKKQYYKNNVEKIAEQNKQYYKDNAKKLAKHKKQYYKDNVEKIAEQRKQYYKNNREQYLKQSKQHYKNNCEQCLKQNKQYYQNNREQKLEQAKQYRKDNALFETYSEQLEIFEEIQHCSQNNELLEVKCAYCGKWAKPTNQQVQNRLRAFNSTIQGENRFYCSENCKQACPIFNQNKYPKGFKQATSREVVPLLRQLVLKRDNYTCQKCGAITETAQLHVHHIIPYAQNKMQANDPDSCITLCKSCHKKVHSENGCRYVDLKCWNNENKE